MYIDIHDDKVQDACFIYLRLAHGSYSPEEADRIQKEIIVAAAGFMARPTERPSNEGGQHTGSD